MLYFLYGDRIEVRKNLKSHLDSLQKKRPDAEVFRVNKDNFTPDLIQELVSSIGLFESKYIVVLDSLLEDRESGECVLKFLKESKEADHIFLLVEESPSKKEIEEISKECQKVWFFPKKENKSFNNIFVLADYLGRKDKKNLWVNYLKFVENGVSGEEIGGILFWQIKNILLTKSTKTPLEAKISPFAYKNATAFSLKWEKYELLDFSSKILNINQKVRDGEGESEVLLEKLILSL